MLTRATPTDWAVFAGSIIGMMIVDYLVFSKRSHRVSFREATIRSIAWISLALAFNVYVFVRHGSELAVPYLVAFLVEKSLSVDNLFVFLAVFSYFHVKEEHQQRILFWGVFGAVVMRAGFILAGAALLSNFKWMIYVFGAFLIITGLKLLKSDDDGVDPESNIALKLARKYLRTTPDLDGQKFFTRKDGLLYATPLFLVIIVIEFTDVIFAVDSVPAVLAISEDLFVVYTSNIFAIMGLRALYFMLSGMMGKFHYLDVGLALVLVFIGVKMTVSGFYHVPNAVSLAVIVGLITVAVVASLLKPAAESAPRESQPE